MSNKKSSKKSAKSNAKKEPVLNEKQKKGVVIAAVALLVAVAVALAVYFVSKDDNTSNPTFSGEVETLPNEGTQYTYAKYKTTKLPVEIVEVLLQADADKAAASEKYGVAVEIGDRDISVPEFVMNYYDIFYNKRLEVEYSIQKTGDNRTGFDPEKLPSEQNHISEPYTWEERFILDSIEKIQNTYMMFDMAVEAGYDPDVVTASAIIDCIESIADSENDITEYYCDGVTKAMFTANEIMAAIAQAYTNQYFSEIQGNYSEADIKKALEESNDAYKVAKVRVYLIEGEYVESELAAVETERDFLRYAQSNYPYEDYDADFSTDCGYITKERLSSVYTEDVAEWVFDKNRKSGEVTVIETQLFRYLVYVDVPAFYSTSVNAMVAPTNYDLSTMTQEDIETALNNAEKAYLDWKNNDGTYDGFYNYSTSSGGTGESVIRIGEYNFEIDNWLFDSSREKGDHAFIETPYGCCAVYYIGKNSDDYDWYANIKANLANEELEAFFNEKAENEYKASRNKNNVEKSCDLADKSINRYWTRFEKSKNEK